MKSDIFRIYLDSENPTTDTESIGEYSFNVSLPSKGNKYIEYRLYVDDFNVCLKGLTTTSVLVKLNIGQYNSYNSQTKGNNNVIATLFNPNYTVDRTIDLSLHYQNPTTPYLINTLPQAMNIKLVDIDNSAIDFSSSNNFWTMNLRVEAIIEGC